MNSLLAEGSQAKSSDSTAKGAEALRADSAVVVPDVLSNSLLISADPTAARRIEELVTTLDRPPQSVLVEVVIVAVESAEKPERIAVQADEKGTADAVVEALSKQGEVRVLARVQLTALDNQPAHIQLGQSKPRVTGVTSTGRGMGGMARQVSFENYGLTLKLTPRISAEEMVTLEVNLERSDAAAPERRQADSVSGDGLELQVSGTDTLSLETTVQARSAHTVVLGGLTERQGQKWRRLVALLTPQIIDH
ncbi:MAG: hypothetical protein JJ992_26570 [Planctomycetes bacterium]|nr:hypothetical protein [Planctomycetota bacterium]